MRNDIEMQDLNPSNLKQSKEQQEANRFLLTIYRITELNWNRPTFSLFRKAFSFFASRYKLQYDDISLYKNEALEHAIKRRDPALPQSIYDADDDIPLLNYTRIHSEFNLEKDVFSCLEKLQQQSDYINHLTAIKNYAEQGNPRFQLLYAFICLKKNDIASAKSFLKQAAKKYDLANFILLRNQLFKSKAWGFDTENTPITQTIYELDKLRNQNKIYTVLCASLIHNTLASKTSLIQYQQLTEGLQKIVKPLLSYYKTDYKPQMIMSYSAPTGGDYPLYQILQSNKQPNIDHQNKMGQK